MADERYPIFSGKVIQVPAILEENGEFITVIDYMSPKDEPTEEERKKIMPLGILSVVIEKHREALNEDLKNRVTRVIVPMRVDPSVIMGADIRTSFGQVNEGEYGEGRVARTYELEVIKAKSQAGSDPFLGLAEMFDRTPHSGMKYIKVIREEK